MAMNLLHRRCCSSDRWAKSVEDELIPWALAEVVLGDNVLEIGPGYGANLRVLIDRAPHYTAVEIDPVMAKRLQDEYGSRTRVVNDDGTATGLPAAEFSSVVCFTMLHHIPTAVLQNQLFVEAFRVLRPGGVFAGSDGVPSLRMRVAHFRDTYNPVSPETLPDRLRHAGFTDVVTDTRKGRQRWRAVKR